ncbi:MAG: AraC family transcriptional regulator [Nocardioidaceae bacterium]
MDTVTAMLDGHSARGAFLLRCVMDSPWSMTIQDRAAVAVLVIASGSAWLVPDEGDPIQLCAGDVAVVRGPDPYLLADTADTPPQIVIEPGQQCRSLRGEDLAVSLRRGVRTWGNGTRGDTVLLTGTYEMHSQVTGRLLEALPDRIVLRNGEWGGFAVPALQEEMARDAPGQDAVLNRLMDLLLVAAVREWFTRHSTQAPAWWNAQKDGVVGAALELMHDEPDQPWSVDRLASGVGVSRATLARRFTTLVGQPPMTYLTSWRLTLAADRLLGTDATVASVARQVGFANPFSFSAAFKRQYGVSPQQFRAETPVAHTL